MSNLTRQTMMQGLCLGLSILGGVLLLTIVLLAVSSNPLSVRADPIEPPGGYPKLKLSVKAVTPTLTNVGSTTLTYTIEIHNTGAYTADGTTLTDVFPDHTTYNTGSAWASVPTVTVTSNTLSWKGNVGFDSTVVVTFSVAMDSAFSGTIPNTAVISHPLIAGPVTATAETIVTDAPILTIEKASSPEKPGANKTLFYTITVANMGQPLTNQPITVTDRVPLSTTLINAGGGVTGTVGSDTMITWTKQLTLELRDTAEFTFSVQVRDVLSGTKIVNKYYDVDSPVTEVKAGDWYTVTVIDPIFLLSKYVWPDPPGSNREMTYTLTLLNVGSLATDLVITDRLPAGAGTYFRYVRGGAENSGVVSWSLDSLDTRGSHEFTYTIYISDVMDLPIVNGDYAVYARGESILQAGEVLTSVVQGPHFEMVMATIDPIARKPGGGNLTTTLVLHNTGPGNALDARAALIFRYISIKAADVYVLPPGIGTPLPLPVIKNDPTCTDHCTEFEWIGPVGVGQVITFATTADPSTQVGSEGSVYSATVVITDGLTLNNKTTAPVTGTVAGKITHMAYLVPTKDGPSVIGRGQVITYTIDVWNSALRTDDPPLPYLWDLLPISGTTLITSSISHSGTVQTVLTGTLRKTVISWTLPAFGTGERMEEPRTFAVRVNNDLVSGTQIVNTYEAHWYEFEDDEIFFNEGQPVTTTVQEVGLIDSYKEVTPTLALPGPGNVLTYYLYIVNSSDLSLNNVTVNDLLPWWPSTYQRDAVASAGDVVSDIVSISWTGPIGPLSEEVITFTALIDEDYEGPVTNTAVISHSDLLDEVVVDAVAYITEKPVLKITKQASPDPVERGSELHYTIRVINLGQQATSLIITDTVPNGTTCLSDTITAGGELVGDEVRWEDIPVLNPGESRTFGFSVKVESGVEVVNDQYVVQCQEGVIGVGDPVITSISGGANPIYLPLVLRNF